MTVAGSNAPKPGPKRSRARASTARDTRAFAAAIAAALGEADGDTTKLHRVAQTLVALAIDGNMAAIKEISDRLDGRAGAVRTEAVKATGAPVDVRLKWLKG